jgi:hypothetical protein
MCSTRRKLPQLCSVADLERVNFVYPMSSSSFPMDRRARYQDCANMYSDHSPSYIEFTLNGTERGDDQVYLPKCLYRTSAELGNMEPK